MRFAGVAVLLMAAGCAADSATSAGKHAAPPARIVFDASTAGGHREVYTVAIDGTGLVQLTSSTGDDIEPSAAGGTVVFTSYRDRNGELYSTGLDGTGERRLTTTTANETLPALAPDGHAIAYVSDASGVARVWIAARDLSGAGAATAAAFAFPGAIETSPAWSPSSDRLVFVASATTSGNAGLFTEPAQAGAVPSAVGGSGSSGPEVEPAWSPDGNRVAFASAAGATTQIFVRDLRTLVVTRMTGGAAGAGQPAWLADGRIVFTQFVNGAPSLAWVDPAAPNDAHAISTPGLAAEHASAVRP